MKITAGFVLLFFILGLVSCGKKSDETSQENVNEAELETVSSNDFKEKDEDLLTVDYREFYEQLAPHGEWIEVKGNDIGVDLKKGSASGKNSSGHRSISIGELFGVKEAYADADFGAFFVWKPAPDLAVGITAGDQPVTYQPYTNGQWVNTTQGWYFRAASEPEEITHHYGRWAYSPSIGWVWVPGRVWAPAWVDWRENDQYVAWTPVPPSVYLVNDVIVAPPVIEENYVVVERRYFVEPVVYKYMYKENKNKIMIKQWSRPSGVMVVNQTVVNRGPSVTDIQTVLGTVLPVVSITTVPVISEVKYTNTEYVVYSPQFKKVKSDVKIRKSVTSPKGFVTFENAVVKNEVEKNSKGKSNENAGSNNNSGNNNSGKDIKNPRVGDDSDMKNGNKNKGNNNSGNNNNSKGNNNKGNNKDNGKKNSKGNDDGNNTKGDKPGKDNSGKDKGKGNDNGGKNKGKGNGNSHDVGKDKGKDNSGKNKGNDNKGGNNKGNNKGKK